MLSTNNCAMTRPRLEPSASRMAISLCRDAARASSRLAMLAQAINKTNPTIAINTASGCENCWRRADWPLDASATISLFWI